MLLRSIASIGRNHLPVISTVAITERTTITHSMFRLIIATVLLAFPIAAISTPNLLDPSFAANGIATTQVSTNFGSRAFDAVLQPDGKLIVVGTGYNAPSFPFSLQAAVIRYNANGTLDTTFDGDDRTDIAVFRNGDWYLLQSTSGFQLRQFGSVGDRPIQSAYIP